MAEGWNRSVEYFIRSLSKIMKRGRLTFASDRGVNFAIEICGESGDPSKHRFHRGCRGKNLQRNNPFGTVEDEFRNYVMGEGKHEGDSGSLARSAMRLGTAMDSVNNLFKRD